MAGSNVFVLVSRTVWNDRSENVGAFTSERALADAVAAHVETATADTLDTVVAQTWAHGVLVCSRLGSQVLAESREPAPPR